MTDLEIMQHAKNYMDQLAAGIDPISGSFVPEDTVLNNVRISKCFTYVSGILQQVIDNGGYVVKPRKIDFVVTEQLKASLVPAENAVRISEFMQMIKTALNSPDVKVPGTTAITDWLLNQGLMEKITNPEGKPQRVPTDAGRQIGIYTQFTKGAYGEYLSVYYSPQAQKFLIDKLEVIFNHES